MSRTNTARTEIGDKLKTARETAGKGYKDIPMNYRTIKNIEEGSTTYQVDNLLQYMAELNLLSLTIKLEDNGQ